LLASNSNIDIEKAVTIGEELFNSIKYEEKRRIGNTFAFWYIKGEPLIVIGPHCIFII
jgi:hypothetical protein